MVYTSPIESITWDAVEEFCNQQTPEGAFLDYKRDFPAELARTIAAMANTLGGVILIGVAEDDGKPVVPLSGVAMERGLAERVTNIILTNLTPPVFPEVSVCPNATKERAIVVVRVPQSPETPHAIRHNTRVYLRTGNRNTPEELATIDQIEWLQSKRARSVALRGSLFGTALHRSDVRFGHVDGSSGVRMQRFGIKPASLVLNAAPQFPRQQYRTPAELIKSLRSIDVHDYYGTDSVFPLGGQKPVLLQDGVYVSAKLGDERGVRHYYTELSVFGQYFFRQTLPTNVDGAELIRASEIFCRLDEFASSAAKYFAQIEYQGFVQFDCAVRAAHGAVLGHWDPNEVGLPTSVCPDEDVAYSCSFLAADWAVESQRAVIAAAKTVCWAYDWDIAAELLAAYYAKYRR